jgi:hypothetical protein
MSHSSSRKILGPGVMDWWGYGLIDGGIVVWFWAGSRNCISSESWHCLWDPLIVWKGYLGHFPQDESGQGLKLTTDPHVVMMLIMSGAILQLLHVQGQLYLCVCLWENVWMVPQIREWALPTTTFLRQYSIIWCCVTLALKSDFEVLTNKKKF